MARGQSILDYSSSLDLATQQILQGKQKITEVKWDTLTLAAGAVPSSTSFFATAAPGDIALKNFDQNSQLVSGGKYFLIQWASVQIIANSAAATFADVNSIINSTAVRFQVDSKVMGTVPTHVLSQVGGTSALSGQVSITAAAAPAGASGPAGVTNGFPDVRPYRFSPILIEPLKTFAALLLGPTGTAITLTGTVTVRICLGGLQFQAIQ